MYNPANRITQFTSPDGSSSYNYDVTDQLTGTDHSFQTDEAYSYDANGNRINTGYLTGTNNRLVSDGEYNYEYDGEGNRTKRTEIATGEVTEYTWDYRNRLTRVVEKNASGNVIKQSGYTYDVFDRRIAKSVDPDGAGSAPATVERFVYDGDHIALTFDGSGTQTHRYLHGPQIDQILASENASGQVLWALTDNQGTVRDLVNSTGTIQNHITYDSYGNVINETNPAIDTRFGYTGREFDAETGQYYYRARYYDPRVGRFLSEDPIGFAAADTNLYRYVFNNPANLTDPSGNVAWVPVILGGLVFPLIADALSPSVVQSPINPCDIVPDPDSANRRAVIELVLGMGVNAAPSAARALGNSVDNLLSGIDNLRPPSAGAGLVPVEGELPALGRGLSEGFGRYAPGLGTQGAAGGALPNATEPLFSSSQGGGDEDPWAELERINRGEYNSADDLTTLGGRRFSDHSIRDSLARHNVDPHTEVDNIIDQATSRRIQSDGATVHIRKNNNGKYDIAIVNEQENSIVTAMKNKTSQELSGMARNNGWTWP